ncbi:hypothetical protein LUZ60_012898 [Juncus effusus]|nr:hypothetical protein LUZ60_012898 [Juncus effusus]
MKQRGVLNRIVSFGIPDVALSLVMGYIDDPRDREAVSLVCRNWHRVDALTRKHVTIAMAYATTPHRLRARFPCLESLKIKAKPRATMFNLIPEDWGGSAAPWVSEIAGSFEFLRSLHLRRMVVSDEDVAVLVRAKGHMLVCFKLDRCNGFSTDALSIIASSCKKLETIFLEESVIEDKDGNWLHELALNNTCLETLNFYLTDLKISPTDLELLARNCKSLTTLKISERNISDLVGFFRNANSLQEFGGGSFDDRQGTEINKYNHFDFPPSLRCLSLMLMGSEELHVIFPYAGILKKLDLQYALFLNTEDHCQLIPRCPNLEILEVMDVVGDRGLEVVAQTCKKLRRLRVERGDDEQAVGAANEGNDQLASVTQLGLISVAQGCPLLEYLAVHVTDITNAALEAIGQFNKNLFDFRLVLLDREDRITELPLDTGVRALLAGCNKLGRFSLYLRPGGLSDVGLGYIGEYSQSIKYMLLGNVGETDQGLMNFAKGCPNLQKLELRSCCFSEQALALAVVQLKSLRYLWVQGYKATLDGNGLALMERPFWNVELIPPRFEIDFEGEEDHQLALETKSQILGYYSLAGKRTDCPQYVIPLYPA